MGPTGAALAIEGVGVRFEGAPAPALDDVDLVVGPGEVVALLGPSGCGKTTLLRIVAGLTAADRGRVLLDGVDLDGVPTHRRGIGLMFQDHALFPHRDVGGNIEFGLRMAGMAPAERTARVAEVLELVGLPGWERRPVGPLSGGERQRVALARALAPSPRLLLLDEPLGALDRSLRDRLVPELGVLFRSVGVTVVHVTHDQSEALGLADTVVVMHRGGIVQEGPPEQLWDHPANAFVARFLGFANVDEGPDGTELVRPEAVGLTVVGHGEGDATVTNVVFHGDHWNVTVERDADAGPLEAKVRGGAVARGDRVVVAIDPGGRQRL